MTENIDKERELLEELGRKWYCMNQEGKIRPVQSFEELRRRGEGEWRCWWKIAHTVLGGVKFGDYIVAVEPVQISTVFLGLDHGYFDHRAHGEHRPIVFETMIFGGSCDDFQWRYATIQAARLGHQAAVEIARMARVVGREWAVRIVCKLWANTLRE